MSLIKEAREKSGNDEDDDPGNPTSDPGHAPEGSGSFYRRVPVPNPLVVLLGSLVVLGVTFLIGTRIGPIFLVQLRTALSSFF